MERDRTSSVARLLGAARGWRLGLAVALAVVVLVATLWPRDPSTVAPAVSKRPTPAARRTLRLGLNIAADSALHAAARRFADLVGERSGGRLEVVVYPDQQLGNDDQMLEMTRQGTLDLVLTPTAKLSSAIPAMQYADLPFYFSGRDEVYAMLDGEPGRMLLAKLGPIDLIGLAFWENGFKQFTANTPIREPADFRKLRMRTMKSRLIVEQFESLGAKTMPIDFHATRQALADGVVDGQENPLVAIVAMRIHEVQKHLTISNHAYLGYVFSASKQTFETLSPELRDVIQRTARELTSWERAETASREARLLETIRAAGVTIHTLTAAELQRFHAVLAPLADKLGLDVGYDLLAKTEELRFARTSAAGGRMPLLIGLDADLSGSGVQAGGAFLRGMQMAVDEIDVRGGLLGRPVRVIARDNGGSSEAARQNLEHLASIPTLVAVTGGMFTSVITDEIADIHRLGIPYLIPWAAGRGLTTHSHRPSYTFRVSITDSEAMPFLVDHVLKVGGPVVVLFEQSAWGRSNHEALAPLLERLPPGRVETRWLFSGDPDVEAKVGALVKGGVRALLMVTNVPLARAVVRAMARQDRPVPVFSQWSLTGSDFWKLEQAALQRVDLRFVQSVLIDDPAATPALRRFAARYRARYGLGPDDPIPSPVGTVQAYDLVHLLARAVTQVGSPDRAAIRQALERLPHHEGLMRDYAPAFTRDRHDALTGQTLYLARFDARGRIVRAD